MFNIFLVRLTVSPRLVLTDTLRHERPDSLQLFSPVNI